MRDRPPVDDVDLAPQDSFEVKTANEAEAANRVLQRDTRKDDEGEKNYDAFQQSLAGGGKRNKREAKKARRQEKRALRSGKPDPVPVVASEQTVNNEPGEIDNKTESAEPQDELARMREFLKETKAVPADQIPLLSEADLRQEYEAAQQVVDIAGGLPDSGITTAPTNEVNEKLLKDMEDVGGFSQAEMDATRRALDYATKERDEKSTEVNEKLLKDMADSGEFTDSQIAATRKALERAVKERGELRGAGADNESDKPWADVEQLKPTMKALLETEVKDWKPVTDAKKKLEETFDITFMPGFIGVEGNVNACKNLASILVNLSVSKYQGRVFKPEVGINDIRPDGTVLFNVDASGELSDPHEVFLFLHNRTQDAPPQEAGERNINDNFPAGNTVESAQDSPEHEQEIDFGDEGPERGQLEPETVIEPEPEPEQELNAEGPERGQWEPETVINPDEEPVPVAPDVRGVNTENDREQRMIAAREKYVKAKKALDKFGALKKFYAHLGGESQERVAEALADAQGEYHQARSEYVGAVKERDIKEWQEMAQSHLREYGKLDAGWIKAGHAVWTAVGEVNAFNILKSVNINIENKVGAFIAKQVNLRTLAYSCLVTAGLWMPAVGLRAASGFFGAKVGAEGARHTWVTQDYNPERIAGMGSLEEVQVALEDLAKNAYYGGRDWSDITSRDDFKALLARRGELIDAIPEAQRAGKIEDLGRFSENERDAALIKEKAGRRATTAIGAVTGAVVGGAAAYFNAPEKPSTVNNEGGPAPDPNAPLERGVSKIKKAFEILHNGKPSGASMEVLPTGDSVLHVGRPGVEGSIMDLEDSAATKGQFDGVLKWLREDQFPNSKASDEGLIHLLAEKLAADKDITVEELSNIRTGALKLTPLEDGKFSVSLDNVDTIDIPKVAPQVEVLDQGVGDVPEASVQTSELNPSDVEPQSISGMSAEAASNLSEGREQAAEIFANRNQVSYETALRMVEDQKQSSDALRHILNKDYKPFMEDTLNISARELNKWQSRKVTDFMEYYAHDELSPKQLKEFKGLADSINSFLSKTSPEQARLIKGDSMRNFLVRLAVERLRK